MENLTPVLDDEHINFENKNKKKFPNKEETFLYNW